MLHLRGVPLPRWHFQAYPSKISRPNTVWKIEFSGVYNSPADLWKNVFFTKSILNPFLLKSQTFFPPLGKTIFPPLGKTRFATPWKNRFLRFRILRFRFFRDFGLSEIFVLGGMNAEPTKNDRNTLTASYVQVRSPPEVKYCIGTDLSLPTSIVQNSTLGVSTTTSRYAFTIHASRRICLGMSLFCTSSMFMNCLSFTASNLSVCLRVRIYVEIADRRLGGNSGEKKSESEPFRFIYALPVRDRKIFGNPFRWLLPGWTLEPANVYPDRGKHFPWAPGPGEALANNFQNHIVKVFILLAPSS